MRPMTGIGRSRMRLKIFELMPASASSRRRSRAPDVGSGGEGPSGAGEDRDLRVRLEFGTHLVEGLDHRQVDRIAHLGAVEPDDHPVVPPFDEQWGGVVGRGGVTRGGAVSAPGTVALRRRRAHGRSRRTAEP